MAYPGLQRQSTFEELAITISLPLFLTVTSPILIPRSIILCTPSLLNNFSGVDFDNTSNMEVICIILTFADHSSYSFLTHLQL